MGSPDRCDLEFMEKFEQCGFTKASWTHEAHVRLAWVQLNRFATYAEALESIRAGIQRFNTFVQSQGYHDTVTHAFTRLIHARALAADPAQTWSEFLRENADLLTSKPSMLERYYSSEALATEESRRGFVAPDRRALPPIALVRNASADDAATLLEIYAPYVRDSAVSFEIAVPTEAEMKNRIREVSERLPWLVLETRGKVAGYAYASRHRAREAYRWTVEVSVYVDDSARRSGVATVLYRRLFHELRRRGYHVALAGVALPNPPSVGFHEALGFEPVGVYRGIGYKLGQWHDVGWWQKRLLPEETPGELGL